MSRRSSAEVAAQPFPTGEVASRQSSSNENQEAQSAQQPQQQPRETTSRSLHEGTLTPEAMALQSLDPSSGSEGSGLESTTEQREEDVAAAVSVADTSVPVEHLRATQAVIDTQLITLEHAETASAASGQLLLKSTSAVAEGKKRARSPSATDIISAQVQVRSPSRNDVEPPGDSSGSAQEDTQRPESESTMLSKRVKSDIAPWMTQRHKRAIRRSLESSSRLTVSSPPKSSTSVTSTKEAAKEARRSQQTKRPSQTHPAIEPSGDLAARMANADEYWSDDLEGDEGFITDVSEDGYASSRGGRADDYDDVEAPDKEEIRDAARDLCMQIGHVEQLSKANLQSRCIKVMHDQHVLDTLLMLASSAEDADFNAWNAVTSECIFHIFVGTRVKEIAEATSNTRPLPFFDPEAKSDSTNKAGSSTRESAVRAPRSSSALADSLAAEAKMKQATSTGKVPTRHSRFGTTINFVGPDGERRVARNQAALVKSVAQLTDEAMHKGRRRAQRRKDAQERGAPKLKSDWTPEAAVALQEWADTFVQAGFEPLAKSILKDIRSERDKLGDLDVARIRIMQIGSFFLEYFLSRRAAAAAQAKKAAEAQTQEEPPADDWPFELVAQWLEPWAFRMVLVRTLQAQEARSWLEFNAAVQLWIALLRLVDELANSKVEREREVAEGLQAEFYYMSETLDACHAIVHSYSAQSFAFLDTVMTFAYVMPKMLERYASNKDHMYVQAKKHVRRSRKDGDLDAAEDEASQIKEHLKETRTEREFRFADFQRKLATKQLTKACIDFLARWRDFHDADEQLNKLVTVMHRIAIKANDYRQFFLANHRAALRKVLSGDGIRVLEARAPKSAADLRKLMDYILRKFSKLSPEEQAIYDQGKRPPRAPKPPRVPAEIAVRPGMSPEEQIGVAVGLLLKKEKMQAVSWVKSALELASATRTELMLRHEEDEARRQAVSSTDDTGSGALLGELEKENESVVDRFQPFELAYQGNDELRTDASLMPELKLLCRLVGLEANEAELVHWRWSVPKEILPAHLDEKIETIERFIREPLDTHGRELNALVMRVRKPRAGGEPDDVLDPADLPDGWNGNQSDSEEDGDYFDRARATGSLISGDHAAADGGLLRTSGGKKRGKASKRGAGGSRKPKRRTQQDFINDSDDEFAFALADLQDEATQRERAASDSHASDAEIDNADRETPPTSSMADEQADEGKVNALQALRAAKQRVQATSKPSEPLQDASERTNRRVDTKRLFLADSDEDEDDILALSSQEQASFLRGSPRPAADDSSNSIIKKRRLAIVDDEDSDDD
ncbi:hypothetical protein L1887_57561 [Cichorium endivia]|nr:hypothetical protein L1887_57561 [Cichorium endivia]